MTVTYEEQLTTWNDAIRYVVEDHIASDGFRMYSVNNRVDVLERLDECIKTLAYTVVSKDDPEIVDYRQMLRLAMGGWLGMGHSDPKLDQLLYANELRYVASVAVAKHHDYGVGNIQAFGHLGLVVRISDKVARLRNLLAKTASPLNEPIQDSWLDVIGYCLIGEMLIEDTFGLPLAPESTDPF